MKINLKDGAALRLAPAEARFADIIWEREPIPSSALVRLSEESLGWKRTTTYTVLKRLCERGLFKMENSLVSALVSREDFYAIQSERAVSENFGGSLPAFIAAFAKRKSLTQAEIDEIRSMIDEYEERGRKK